MKYELLMWIGYATKFSWFHKNLLNYEWLQLSEKKKNIYFHYSFGNKKLYIAKH